MKKIKFEFGLIRDGQGKICFDPPNKIGHCNQGCVIYAIGCFYFTILRKDCANEKV